MNLYFVRFTYQGAMPHLRGTISGHVWARNPDHVQTLLEKRFVDPGILNVASVTDTDGILFLEPNR